MGLGKVKSQQIGNNLAVGFADKLTRQGLFQFLVVVNDAVVNNNHVAPGRSNVGVSISFADNPVSGPPSMADAGETRHLIQFLLFVDFGDFAYVLLYLNFVVVECCNSHAVVASVLHSFEALDDHRSDIATPTTADY